MTLKNLAQLGWQVPCALTPAPVAWGYPRHEQRGSHRRRRERDAVLVLGSVVAMGMGC